MSLLARAIRASSVLLFAVVAASRLSGCAEAQCNFNSDCPAGLCVDGECVRECFASIDCPSSKPSCVRGVCEADPGVDGGVDTGTQDSSTDTTVTDSTVTDPDTGAPPFDTGSPPDTTVPPTDTATGGTKSYLTACASDGECAAGICTTSAPRFCTKSCAGHTDCAHGQICAGGLCRVDDSGRSCTSASSCLSLCAGIPGASHCTHTCSTGADCPAGYACTTDGSGTKFCIDIERPCGTPEQCPSGLGFCGSGGDGCTATCTSAADCPQRWVGLPPYTCEVVSGQKVCVAPTDVRGSSVMGASCPSIGTNTCRSAVCIGDSTIPWTCAQRCSVRGGCPVSWGCHPLEVGTTELACSPAGALWLGSTCTRGRDCLSGICQAPGYCTRMCADGLCPDGMSCVASGLTATDGTPVSLCTKP